MFTQGQKTKMMMQEGLLPCLQSFPEKNLKGKFMQNGKVRLMLLLHQYQHLNACKRAGLEWIINCSDRVFFSSQYLLLTNT